MSIKHVFTLVLTAIIVGGCSSSSVVNKQAAVVPTFTVEEFFETTTVYGSDINDAGSAVLISSDVSGVFNAYKIPIDGSAPIALTKSEDNFVSVISWLEGEDRILFTSDEGGNELNHIYLRESDGRIKDLTPGENLKATFAGWHADKKSFFITTNERDPKAFDLYNYSAEDFSRKLVFENTFGTDDITVSKDGRYLAMSKSISNRKTDLYLVDTRADNQTPILITPANAQVAYSVYSFSPDSSALVYASNEEGEFATAYTYDLSSGKKALLYQDDWDVSFLYFSETGRYKVVGINADARTDLWIIDLQSNNEVKLPTLPIGNISGVSFADNDASIAFYVNADNAPSNLYYHKLGSEQVIQLTNTLNPNINSQQLVQSSVERFKSFDNLVIPGLLYKPHRAAANAKVPAIILVHGGPGGQARQGYDPLIQHLVNNGYAIFDVNNRGSSGYGKTFFHLDDKRHGEDDLQDIVHAKYFLQTLDWVEPKRIAVMGGSYGGYMTMAALAFTDEFKLGINIFGVTNWVRTLESIPPWWESFRQSLYDELGDPATDKDRLYKISPLFHADKIKAPVLIVQGANDPRVLQVESDEMVENIRATGTPVEYVLFDDEGHGFSKKENRVTAQKAYSAFLEQYL